MKNLGLENTASNPSTPLDFDIFFDLSITLSFQGETLEAVVQITWLVYFAFG